MTLKEQLIQRATECAHTVHGKSTVASQGEVERYTADLEASYQDPTTRPCPECWMYHKSATGPQYIKAAHPADYEGEAEPELSSDYWGCSDCGFKCEVKKIDI